MHEPCRAPAPQDIAEVLPKAGLVVSEKGSLTEILCKPKLMPLKSVTLQKLEEMEVHGPAIHSARATTRPSRGRGPTLLLFRARRPAPRSSPASRRSATAPP
jgi:hypothetical protein